MQTTSTPPARPTPVASPLRRFVGRRMYRWHRTLGLLTLLPVLMWTLSGISCCTAPSLVAETPAAIGTPAAGPAPARADLLSPELITRFAGEYGFVNKRLPVMKLAFATPEHTALYVEPASGRLAALVTDGDRRKGLSFAVLHKFFLLDWAGKNVRDAVAMLSALGVLSITLYGFALLLRTRR